MLLRATLGVGINDISPGLVQPGPTPIGPMRANLDNATRGIVEEMGLNGVGHLKAIANGIQLLNAPPLSRPLVDLSPPAIAGVLFLNPAAFVPPFNPYANTLSFLIAINIITSVLVTYEGAMASAIVGNAQQQLLSGIERTNAAELGVIRAQLYASVNAPVPPYPFTVENLVDRAAEAANVRGKCGVKEEGLTVPVQQGAEGRTSVNIVAGDVNALAFTRNEPEVLRILFGTGNATVPGGVFPAGLPGIIYQLILTVFKNLA
ncbi:hypothetical protein GQ457_02G002760 [Hibiscus cannabinus]